ncbi:MAG: class I SAM-dependent methyltransferase [Gammaproteobacteria bacterium]|nr:class I SAM-dependent methyltransferase [Gammaproteobacteria bacterium]
MQDKLDHIDKGRAIDWGATSQDYATYRPGPPDSFYEKLLALDVGLRGQRILDLGTGTGVLAREFAKQGAVVSGIDISPEQIEQAKLLAAQERLPIDFRVSSAETTPFKDNSFDVITANQCWLYFDAKKTICEVKRLLTKEGVLVVSLFSWLPRLDAIAYQSEQLILKHNPVWNSNDYDGYIEPLPEWAQEDFYLKGFFYFDVGVPFTHESWRGRIRACRGVAAALNTAEVEQFDHEHQQLLKKITPENFTILHRIAARIMVPK